MARTVLITGAAGSIGRKLRAHLEAKGGYELRLLDRVDGGDPAVTVADLAVWDEAWVARFKGVDAVIQLAGNPRPEAPWASIQRDNIDLVLNVYEAAARQGARRLVFASSNWTMAGHRFAEGPLPTDREPYPINPYGVSKLMGERLGRSYSERWGLSVICFRIGYCQHIPGNPPGPTLRYNEWGQLMWVSDRDICQAHEKALLAPDTVRFAVLNLMSDNPGMRWDIETTREVIGYVPQDGAVPQLTDEMRANEEAAAEARSLIEHTEALAMKLHW
jgi:nucleoside-diphosphate-sugar epimerase